MSLAGQREQSNKCLASEPLGFFGQALLDLLDVRSAVAGEVNPFKKVRTCESVSWSDLFTPASQIKESKSNHEK